MNEENEAYDTVVACERLLSTIAPDADHYFIVRKAGQGEYDSFTCLMCPWSTPSLFMAAWHSAEYKHVFRRVLFKVEIAGGLNADELEVLYMKTHDPQLSGDTVKVGLDTNPK